MSRRSTIKKAILNVLDYLPEEERHLINRERISRVMSELPLRDRLILRMRFGLDGGEPKTQAEIAEALGMTQQAVSWRLRRYGRLNHN